ncbi:LCP family protein [Ornithinibacillus californiensis]|uniref:LCP family protein n=1 Tax=Ornithinibacillus californiensis TaxID=161536 RepID=UPI00064DED36|nr:LCP family protein [Ornithinibacillus californiensis]
MPQSRVSRRRNKRKLRKRVYVITPILILFLSVIGYAISLYIKADTVFTASHVEDTRDGGKSDLREEVVDPKEDNVSILFIGVDSSQKRGYNDSARSDALILATLNKEDKSVKMVSIPRDSLVYIPEVGYETKINHAHAYGGPEATIGTVENLFGIPVDYYVRVNFEAFIDIVNALGGINVDVPFEMWEQNSQDIKGAIHLLPGEQKLDGEKALAFARSRMYDNDIERGKRQQEVIKAIVKKGISLGSVFKYGEVIEAVGENMTTNLTFDEMKSFISYGLDGGNLSIESSSLEGYDYQPADAYYWKLDEAALEAKKLELKQHLEVE